VKDNGNNTGLNPEHIDRLICAGVAEEEAGPLFRTTIDRHGHLTDRRIRPRHVLFQLVDCVEITPAGRILMTGTRKRLFDRCVRDRKKALRSLFTVCFVAKSFANTAAFDFSGSSGG